MFTRLLLSRPLASTPTAKVILNGQTRSLAYWQEHVYRVRDSRDGSLKFEDPEMAAERMVQGERAEGTRVRFKQRYEKPTAKRKRLENERLFKTKKRGVEELKAYIQFMKNHKEKQAK
uniref:Uncharacterized protein n=1 Tax=Ditylum brightwellii TaxID=49249 RepID=A0A6U3SV15_9STRA|mmetsp:Transcript_9403/g.13800  ORF Transcript_9403/g.13800 Transcript_9403/m.13800 type:complete len:118 (-) Transcript_9403:522-875(-)